MGVSIGVAIASMDGVAELAVCGWTGETCGYFHLISVKDGVEKRPRYG
jgi:hypothetical protein